MKIGIVGPKKMAITWEQQLRYIAEVKEVIIARDFKTLKQIDACLVLGEATPTTDSSKQLFEALKRGYHTLWVAPLPTNPEEIRKWYHASEESGVIVMFSMWAHYSPATQWMFNQIFPPRKIHIHREWPGPQHTPDPHTLYRIFLEEISLCLEWTRSRPVRIDGDHLFYPETNTVPPVLQQLLLQFGNGTSASIFLNPYGLENRHSRFVMSDKMAAVCQINEHIVKKWLLSDDTLQTPEVIRFDYKDPARHLLYHFIRAVRTGEQPAFGLFELNQLATLIQQFPET
ncbi:MAG: hypothetical protein WD097_09085 [Balneolales bacterium]